MSGYQVIFFDPETDSIGETVCPFGHLLLFRALLNAAGLEPVSLRMDEWPPWRTGEPGFESQEDWGDVDKMEWPFP